MRNVIATPLNIRNFAIATLVPLIVMFTAMALKPLWRDEFWSLFFVDPSLDFTALVNGRLRDEVHPPFYYFLLHHWQNFSGGTFAQRLMGPVLLALTALGLFFLTPKEHKRFLWIFLLVCCGSYWVIYFAAEIRPYVLLFCLSSLSVFLTWRLIEGSGRTLSIMTAWLGVGAMMGVTHYFGVLWFACLGFCVGISFWFSGDKRGFFTIGIFTILALVPVFLWLMWSLPVMDLSDEISSRGFGEQLQFTGNQYLRGLLVKTFGSNPLITFLGFGGLIAAVKFKDRTGRVLISAVILMTLLAFILHFSYIELIKERAFAPQMPAILFVLAMTLSNRESKLMRFVPIVTVIMPFLFIGEYFKDREKIGDMQARLIGYAIPCEGDVVLAYYQDIPQDEFNPFISDKIMQFSENGTQFSVKLVDASKVNVYNPTDCPLKAVALVMPKRRGKDAALQTFVKAGLNFSGLTELEYGKARNIIWIEE